MIYQNRGKNFHVEAMTDISFLILGRKPSKFGDRCEFRIEVNRDELGPGKIDGNIGLRTNDPEFPLLNVRVTGEVVDN
jgi:hypothetical protein